MKKIEKEKSNSKLSWNTTFRKNLFTLIELLVLCAIQIM